MARISRRRRGVAASPPDRSRRRSPKRLTTRSPLRSRPRSSTGTPARTRRNSHFPTARHRVFERCLVAASRASTSPRPLRLTGDRLARTSCPRPVLQSNDANPQTGRRAAAAVTGPRGVRSRRRSGCDKIERSRPSIATAPRLRRNREESAVDRDGAAAATGSRGVGRRCDDAAAATGSSGVGRRSRRRSGCVGTERSRPSIAATPRQDRGESAVDA